MDSVAEDRGRWAVVFSGSHVWVADTHTPASRQQWLATLKRIEVLKPVRVVPGHYLGDAPAGLAAVSFNADYLTTFDAQAKQAKTADALIAAMETAYPDLTERSWLELGARVVKSDMKWPQ